MRYFANVMVCCFLVLSFLSRASSGLAQSQGGDKAQEGLYSQLIRGVIRLEEHQSICTPGRDWAIEADVPVGSAFFVRDRLPDEGATEVSRFFVVTARHVVENHADLFARVQTKAGSSETMVLRLPRQLWVFHPAPIQPGRVPVDVAAMMIPTTDFAKAFLHCMPDENPGGCGTDEQTKQPFVNQVGDQPQVMDPAIILGFPAQLAATHAVEPFARAGIVAYKAPNPDLLIGGIPPVDDSLFLIDALAFPGNSGGPVMREMLPLIGGIQLWGLVTASEPYQARYTIATPAKRIRETLVHARSAAKLNSDAWSTQLPKLPLKCTP